MGWRTGRRSAAHSSAAPGTAPSSVSSPPKCARSRSPQWTSSSCRPMSSVCARSGSATVPSARDIALAAGAPTTTPIRATIPRLTSARATRAEQPATRSAGARALSATARTQ
eukprot:6508844-Prymnesium_polylepis.1